MGEGNGVVERLERLQLENARLREQLVEREVRVAELEAVNASLAARLADLEERVGRNPRNSSMPPSAEGLSKPTFPNRAQRRAITRKPGKQPGSEGKHLAQVEDPDEVVTHRPSVCRRCGDDLTDA
jgi:transposase